MLHTVNKSPMQTNDLASCLAHLGDGRLLLIEDGVYGAIAGTGAAKQLAAPASEGRVYVLGPDLEARGVDQSTVADGVQVVDYNGFVRLVAEHGPHQAWV